MFEPPSQEDLERSAALLKPCRVNLPSAAWSAAEEDGWNMWDIRLNLEKSAEERMREHNFAIRQILEMREAFQRQYGRHGAVD